MLLLHVLGCHQDPAAAPSSRTAGNSLEKYSHKREKSKDVLSGKAAQGPGAGDVSVWRCEHAGPQRHGRHLHYFGNILEILAADKIVFAV